MLMMGKQKVGSKQVSQLQIVVGDCKLDSSSQAQCTPDRITASAEISECPRHRILKL